MSNMESFYAGRQGSSFVIVKRFDGIDIPENEYKYRWFAQDNNGYFIIIDNNLIERTSKNYRTYPKWGKIPCDGITTVQSANGETSTPLPVAYQEGMIQCFQKGRDTVNEVSFGEYVIIDTIFGRGEINDPDNGKVFCRGVNHTDNLGGAEYIGQIVGPQGTNLDFNFRSYTNLLENHPTAEIVECSELNKDLVPGYRIENNQIVYEDKIKYAYYTLKDEYDNTEGCLIGFRIPTLVTDFVGIPIDPYTNREKRGSDYFYTDLITPNAQQYENNKWKHPFYQKWDIKIPQGYHGIDSTNIEIVHTRTMPAGFKDNYPGAKLYTDVLCETPYLEEGEQVILTEARDVLKESFGVVYYPEDEPVYDVSTISCKVNYKGHILYVKKEDCNMDIIRYRQKNYENIKEGETVYYKIGDYNSIQRITLSENGVLTAFYTYEENPYVYDQVIRWIDTVNANGITLDNDGTVTIYYNTVHEDEQGNIVHDSQKYSKILDWITDVSLNQEGKFTVLFNNDTISNGKYETTLEWIDLINISEDGIVSFYYNTDHDTPIYQAENKIKYITNLEIQTAEDGELEGTGDQKLHVTYNVTDEEGQQITEILGNPINYIIETAVSRDPFNYPDAGFGHLLVYYSDPALRETLRDKWVSYPSTKYEETVWDEWVDLGVVNGDTEGLRIIGNVYTLEELYDEEGHPIPPEILMNNPNYAGWAMTVGDPESEEGVQIYTYEYKDTPNWYNIGSASGGVGKPEYIIAVAPEDEPPEKLQKNGIWLVIE